MVTDLLARLGLGDVNSGVCGDNWVETPGGREIGSVNPATGEVLARVVSGAVPDYDRVVDRAVDACRDGRMVPAPRRGEVVRLIGLALREHKSDLGLLITLETGKSRSEG